MQSSFHSLFSSQSWMPGTSSDNQDDTMSGALPTDTPAAAAGQPTMSGALPDGQLVASQGVMPQEDLVEHEDVSMADGDDGSAKQADTAMACEDEDDGAHGADEVTNGMDETNDVANSTTEHQTGRDGVNEDEEAQEARREPWGENAEENGNAVSKDAAGAKAAGSSTRRPRRTAADMLAAETSSIIKQDYGDRGKRQKTLHEADVERQKLKNLAKPAPPERRGRPKALNGTPTAASRGRGRPRKSDVSGSLGGRDVPKLAKKRGRPPGSKTSTATEKASSKSSPRPRGRPPKATTTASPGSTSIKRRGRPPKTPVTDRTPTTSKAEVRIRGGPKAIARQSASKTGSSVNKDTIEPPKRRGRPPKNTPTSKDISQPPKKRGRPPKNTVTHLPEEETTSTAATPKKQKPTAKRRSGTARTSGRGTKATNATNKSANTSAPALPTTSPRTPGRPPKATSAAPTSEKRGRAADQAESAPTKRRSSRRV